MPDIIIKNEYGEDEVYRGVNTVRFLNEAGNVVSYKYNSGETHPRPNPNQHRVRFIDYDGFVWHEIYVDSGDTVYYPESNPAREGYVFKGWNWSLESLACITSDVDVGAMYIAESSSVVDSATSASMFHIVLPDCPSVNKLVDMRIYSEGANSFLIDWGDGTTTTASRTQTTAGVLTGNQHAYSEVGEYTISVVRTSGDAEYYFGQYGKTATQGWYNLLNAADYRLKSVVLSPEIKYIPYMCFYQCYRLTSVSIPNSVTAIGPYAFDADRMIEYVAIPDSVVRIDKYAFYGCYKLKAVAMASAGLTTIADYAFSNCYSLRSVELPITVSSIGQQAFSSCYALEYIDMPGVTSIGQYAFTNCVSLKTVTIPEGVTKIPVNMCSGCSSLANANIPSTVTSIDGYAFYRCYALKPVVLPDGITTIPTKAFAECTSMESITIPSSVTSIGDTAFYQAYTVADVYIKSSTPPTYGSSQFYGISGFIIHVPAGSEDAYKTASGWSTHSSYIVGDL